MYHMLSANFWMNAHELIILDWCGLLLLKKIASIRIVFENISKQYRIWKNILNLIDYPPENFDNYWQLFARLSSTVDDIFHNGQHSLHRGISQDDRRRQKFRAFTAAKFTAKHGFLRGNCAAVRLFFVGLEREREREKRKIHAYLCAQRRFYDSWDANEVEWCSDG